MLSKRDRVSLNDIVQACRLVQQFSRDLTEDSFDRNVFAQSAILYQLIIMGEAVKRLSSEFRSAHPRVEWTEMAGMRDMVVHQYHRVALRLVWGTVRDDVPAVLEYIERVLADEE